MTPEEVKEAMISMEYAYLKPKDFTRSADYTYNLHELLDDRWRLAIATNEGFIFARRHIPPTPEEETAERDASKRIMESLRARSVVTAETSAIKPGDVVTLKSGGLKMTVQSIKDQRANCVWHFDGVHHSTFAVEALVAA